MEKKDKHNEMIPLEDLAIENIANLMDNDELYTEDGEVISNDFTIMWARKNKLYTKKERELSIKEKVQDLLFYNNTQFFKEKASGYVFCSMSISIDWLREKIYLNFIDEAIPFTEFLEHFESAKSDDFTGNSAINKK